MSQPYIVCPKCGTVSHNANDVKNRYCGACKGFHDDLMREAGSEIGRKLKASELEPHTIVVVEKADLGCVTFWVKGVSDQLVHLYAGEIGMDLLLLRVGPDRESVTDDSGAAMTIYQYLGEP
jgi:ribosomal protein L37E